MGIVGTNPSHEIMWEETSLSDRVQDMSDNWGGGDQLFPLLIQLPHPAGAGKGGHGDIFNLY